MKININFDLAKAPQLVSSLRHGLAAYAIDAKILSQPTTMWIQSCDDTIFRVDVDMHDIVNWQEIGTLVFEAVPHQTAPTMTSLPKTWSCVTEIFKLVYDSADCEAECGLTLVTEAGDKLTIVAGANIYSLAIKADFYREPFLPEYELNSYHHVPLP